MFFFFKQKPAYEMRISDWSSDVCSSDLESSHVVGYDVTYRNPDGSTGTMRMGSKPGSRISLGTQDKTVGYDVTYRYEGTEQTIRMDQKPGDRLPVIDGQVVTQTAAADAANRG